MPNSILEAMAAGVICLVRKNKGNCDLIKDEFNGYVFNDLT
jgi:hypothetical protein